VPSGRVDEKHIRHPQNLPNRESLEADQVTDLCADYATHETFPTGHVIGERQLCGSEFETIIGAVGLLAKTLQLGRGQAKTTQQIGRGVRGMTALSTLAVRDRQQWRRWLARNHASSPGVWLVYYKGHKAAKSVSYEDSLQEALCFGWIDSLVKRLDDERYARKFTPRKPDSKWSEANRALWGRLKAERSLAPAGLAAAPTENRYTARPQVPELPEYLALALKTNARAWRFFRGLARTYQRPFVVWVHTAKREETREKRLREAIRLLASGKKLGLK
jgi:uncharacterized protein YdeI (YjbR/CyaY-like superfamily)